MHPAAALASPARRCSPSRACKSDDGALHPVQQALVDCHGVAMRLLHARVRDEPVRPLQERARARRARDVDDALSGNLCRCTGYRPIVAAAQRMYDAAAAPPDWRGPGVAADGSRRDQRRRGEARGATRGARARRTRSTTQHGGQRWFAPRTLDALARGCAPRIPTRASSPAPPTSACGSPSSIATSATSSTSATCASLRAIRDDGRRARHRRRRRRSPTRSRRSTPSGPSCTKAWQRFASVPIRNSGTLGGNVANGSPIGDSMPALIALGATVVLRHGGATREMPLEDFLPRLPEDRAATPGEFVAAVRDPAPRAPDLAAARVQGQQALRPGHLRGVRVLRADARRRPHRARRASAAAAWRPTPKRADGDRSAARRASRGTTPRPSAAATALASEFAPIDDMRATRRLPARRARQPAAAVLARNGRRAAYADARRRRAAASRSTR